MPPCPFRLTERIRWADVDLVGIMRFSAVTRFVEMAEQELMRDAGLPYRMLFDAPEIWMPRRHLSVDFLAPARIDDLLTLVTYVSRLGDTSVTFNVDLWHADGTLVAAATMVVVCVTVAEFTKRPVPPMVREALAPYVCSVEEARSAPSR
ncbi:MAG: acyl-CoA thioesterase [Gemmatimonas sp.]|jgi:acyl-CoA thioester hydrolase|uniref:acyl-CoA thioesterase n=1 Tax=Gemmatimonas sp. TaxID=1962908 RepID=UPI00391EFCEC|nr:acyl-CoA thioesterase [Gemmatimonadota bacterium]